MTVSRPENRSGDNVYQKQPIDDMSSDGDDSYSLCE